MITTAIKINGETVIFHTDTSEEADGIVHRIYMHDELVTALEKSIGYLESGYYDCFGEATMVEQRTELEGVITRAKGGA